MNEANEPIRIDIVSDVVCPWCYIGQRRLRRTVSALQDVTVDIRWRPFQLDPTVPPGGHDRRAYMLAKFGGAERLAEVEARLLEAGREEGIDFNLQAIAVVPNTLDAHRVIRWAASAEEGVQDRLVQRLFALYFEEGADIGDRTVLAEAAEEIGMDRALVEALLAGEADVEAVKGEIATATRMGIRGVPCFLLESRYAIVGAQDPAMLADAITRVAEARARGEIERAV